MRFELVSALALAGSAAAAPRARTQAGYSPFPLPNGFPNPSPEAIQQIQKDAGGTLPNGPLPPNPGTPASALDLQVVATNEIFEVAYFTQLLQNVTECKPGYEVPSKWGKTAVEAYLKQVIAQEELHALLANTALEAYGAKAITPARYDFPVNDLVSALDFAGLFTSLVLGALQSVQVDLTNAMAPGLVQVVGSIIGQEGEQTGFYRLVGGRPPSASPFLTVAPGAFAFNALAQTVIVPGSNMNEYAVEVPVYDALTVVGTPEPKNSTLTYNVVSQTAPTTSEFITYISGQNVPVSVPIQNVQSAGAGAFTFQAEFPFEGGFSQGLTLASITKNNGPFADVGSVAGNTTAGPGLIYIK